MEFTKKYKLQILFPLILVVVVLIGTALYNILANESSSNYHCDIGQDCLNDLDYSGAILAFSNAITLDPTNTEARVGLAKAYNGAGEKEFSIRILTDVISSDKMHPQIANALLDIYDSYGDENRKISVLHTMISQTDDNTYYEKLTDAIARKYEKPHTYAQTDTHAVCIKNGTVMTRGDNAIGQLGTAVSVGVTNAQQDVFADAQFSGKAHAVYAYGKTTYVIDDTYNLWAAGENRWGQIGSAYGSLTPTVGWTRITDTGDIVAIDGAPGILFILKKDGTLCYSGVYASHKIVPCALPAISSVRVTENTVYALAVDGTVYTASIDVPLKWMRLSSSTTYVIDFAANGYSYGWIDSNGAFYSNGIPYPSTWTYQDNYYLQTDILITELETNGTNTVFMDVYNQIYYVDNDGNNKLVKRDSKASSLYSDTQNIYAVYEDGTILQWGRDNGRMYIIVTP